MLRAFVATSAASTVALVGAVVGYGYGLPQPPSSCGACGSRAERVDGATRIAAYDAESSSFDASVDAHEYWSGISHARRSLIGTHARGRVLEVASGTGRNIGMYDADKVREVTAVDASRGMLAEAEAKAKHAGTGGVTMVFVHGDVEALGKVVKRRSVDTVVDTFGLCSYDDPVGALRAMANACKLNGEILLLEHGRSQYTWLNNILDAHAHAHAVKWGCYWNRDIVALVKEAGLEIIEHETRHLGTTSLIRARPVA